MSGAPPEVSPSFRCGYVAIIGEPNVGKSTLMNALLEQKISIVTPKPQTTRHKVLGIQSTNEYQIIFLDTPGIILPKYRLHEMMMNAAGGAIADADVLLFMISANEATTNVHLKSETAFKKVDGIRKPVFLIINKIDLVGKQTLLPLIDHYAKSFPFREILPISVLTGENVKRLLPTTIPHLPVHPPLYPLDIVSEHPERFFASEIIREKVFLACREEVPYSTTVDIVEFKERETGKTFISADVYVERESQKGILIGKQGGNLKKIGQLARTDIEEFIGHPVFLELHVKVRKWREDDQWLSRLGYK